MAIAERSSAYPADPDSLGIESTTFDVETRAIFQVRSLCPYGEKNGKCRTPRPKTKNDGKPL